MQRWTLPPRRPRSAAEAHLRTVPVCQCWRRDALSNTLSLPNPYIFQPRRDSLIRYTAAGLPVHKIVGPAFIIFQCSPCHPPHDLSFFRACASMCHDLFATNASKHSVKAIHNTLPRSTTSQPQTRGGESCSTSNRARPGKPACDPHAAQCTALGRQPT